MAKTSSEDVEAEDVEAEPRSKKKLIVILLLPVVLGLVAYLLLFSGSDQAEAEEVVETEVVEAPGSVVVLDEVVVNLADSGSRHYLRATFALQLTATAVEEDVLARAPVALDAMISYLSSLDQDTARSDHISGQLKDDLSTTVVEALGDESVEGVLITSFLVQ